ncbi:GlsB/YeaQ/YmgE family stress response membrane protein [Burkholderia sp. BCC1988]|uniref:GlsB/YeaQ/YmgE family stress response membrane protein n=1 Tax=Burkholderia sp. BCC1988 TaxID=2817443 RepID=UPI002AB17889|nr:GlsB/YeaQ/YmgE family stress response membrane protein [Burkholderia sp. BCC1988]
MLHNLIIWLIVGGISGWLAGMIVTGGGFGILIDVLVGVAGAIVGGWITSLIGISIGSGILSSIIVAVGGAVVLLFLLNLIRRA